ncbi:MAG: SMP-30/gluconolactonase/LRE family protein [Akkermansiaceae bacterium]|jgi:sugar lactone lactonase YvrE|nr:SMP-30/gluconolactonase/LRE family protein [Akkermansiaceae bacterium]
MVRIEPVGHIRSQWGEGPVWWRDALYYVDIEGRLVHRYDPADGSEKSWDAGQRVGTVVPRASGGLVIAGDHGFSFLDEASGALTAIADPEANLPDNRFNDGKCSPDGRFFAGTISLAKKTGAARLYRLDPDLSVREAFGPVTNSNGIIWSADGKTCYYIDTPRKEVLAFDYEQGLLRDPRPVIRTGHIEASPDGMTIDADGHLWIAFCHGGCVSCFDPQTGDELHRIALPCLETTACAFGGPDLTDLFVTTGIHKTAVEEHAGRLFVIRGLKIKGLPAHAFAG